MTEIKKALLGSDICNPRTFLGFGIMPWLFLVKNLSVNFFGG